MHCTEATLTLAADVDGLDKLFAFIGENLEKAGCPEDVKSRIELAAEEIFVNIANYSFKGSSGGSCEITMTTGSGEATIAFRDRGIPFNPLEHGEPDTGIALEEREEGGLGIFIAKRVMDVVEYSYEGMNHLLMKKRW
jgi:anti-sigma regulatory factor (Ser/Thr protein kinase)